MPVDLLTSELDGVQLTSPLASHVSVGGDLHLHFLMPSPDCGTGLPKIFSS